MSSLAIPDPATTDWVPLNYGASIQTNVPACRVYNSAAVPVPSGAWTYLPFDSERFDTDNIHDTATNTNRLTCRTAGKYLIVGHMRFAAINVACLYVASISVNGSKEIARQSMNFAPANSSPEYTVAAIYDLAVGDYVVLGAYQNSGSTINIERYDGWSPEFEMTYLGPGLVGRGMQNLAGTYVNRPPANSVPMGTTYFAVDALGTWLSDGTQWYHIAQRPAYGAPSMLGQAPWTTPYEGMEVCLTDSYTAPTYQWHFKYNAQSNSAYKWELLGGAPLILPQASTQTLGVSNTWTNLSPSLWTVPRSGEWEVSGAAVEYNPGAISTQYFSVYANTVGNNYISAMATHTASYMSLATPIAKVAIASGVNIGLCGYGLSGAQYLGGMSLVVQPARIS